MKWIRDNQIPPMLLPEGVDITGWSDITEVLDPCRRYLNPETGEVIGGVETYEQFQRDMHMLLAKGCE